MSVVGYTGRKGSGKSLSATYVCWDAFQRGWEVYSNGVLKFGKALDVNDLINLEIQNAVVFIDEAHVFFESRRAARLLNVEASNFLIQVRKLNVRLVYATHYLGLIDKRLAWATDIEVGCMTEDEGRNIVWELRDLSGQYGRPGTTRMMVLRRAYRFWHLYDTNSLQAVWAGRVDKDAIREQRRLWEAQQAAQAVNRLIDQGRERASAMDVAVELLAMDVQLSPERVGKLLGIMGLQPKNHSGRRLYVLQKVPGGI